MKCFASEEKDFLRSCKNFLSSRKQQQCGQVPSSRFSLVSTTLLSFYNSLFFFLTKRKKRKEELRTYICVFFSGVLETVEKVELGT
jgi:hypothetical protein